MKRFGNQWDELLQEEWEKPYYKRLRQAVIQEYNTQTVYPKPEEVMNALKAVDYDRVRVVILGQDPYHGPGQAHGFSFSVQEGVQIPPSLRNIYKEIETDTGRCQPPSGNLIRWAKQGVLLLNTILTVRKSEPMSHQHLGWQIFTDEVLKKLNERETPIVFMLWGSPARRKKELIDTKKNLVLESVHPSPLSAHRGFFGCRHFSKANEFLQSHGMEEIQW